MQTNENELNKDEEMVEELEVDEEIEEIQEELQPLTDKQQSTTVLAALIMVIGSMPVLIVGFILSIIALKWLKDIDDPAYHRISRITKVLAILSIVFQGIGILFFLLYIILIVFLGAVSIWL